MNMSRIRGRDTGPELAVRRHLHKAGIRKYRINYKLLGKPDIVFPSSRLAVFIDGCFWHKCPLDFREPATRKSFWMGKIESNVNRDIAVNRELSRKGWQVKRFWEHEVGQDPAKVAASISLALERTPSASLGRSHA